MAAYRRAVEVIEQNRDKLDAIAKYLIEHETMDAVELARIFGEKAPADVDGAPVPA
ncbi:MAG: hypothetical protein KatS3mg060_2047 [Dehalococcoidia bacterium]|nr:MAG: hypothetical protein KatS3mg060_2047 [Dehalococcoidia bacterium]